MGMGANQYSTENSLGSTDPAQQAPGILFGFRASKVLVLNDKAAPVYVSLGSTAGSTAGHRTCAGESLEFLGSQVEAIGIASTTTSTGTNVRVSAWGW